MINDRKEKGFTIVELAIVIAIMGILAMSILPRFGTMGEAAEVSFFRSVVSDVTLAVKEGTNRGIPLTDLRDQSNTTRGLPVIANIASEGINEKLAIAPTGTGILTVTLTSDNGSTKTAEIEIDSNGNVSIKSISGFTRHSLQNGDIIAGS